MMERRRERTEEWPKWINEGRITIKEEINKHVNDWSMERMKEEKEKTNTWRTEPVII